MSTKSEKPMKRTGRSNSSNNSKKSNQLGYPKLIKLQQKGVIVAGQKGMVSRLLGVGFPRVPRGPRSAWGLTQPTAMDQHREPLASAIQ